MCALSLTVCEIIAKQEKCQNFDLENECQGKRVEERDLRHSTGYVGIHISDFFQNFSYLGTLMQKSDTDIHTHTHTHIHSERQGC